MKYFNAIVLGVVLGLCGCKCTNDNRKQLEEGNGVSINCYDVGDFHRCENAEVLCYAQSRNSNSPMQCIFKKLKQ